MALASFTVSILVKFANRQCCPTADRYFYSDWHTRWIRCGHVPSAGRFLGWIAARSGSDKHCRSRLTVEQYRVDGVGAFCLRHVSLQSVAPSDPHAVPRCDRYQRGGFDDCGLTQGRWRVFSNWNDWDLGAALVIQHRPAARGGARFNGFAVLKSPGKIPREGLNYRCFFWCHLVGRVFAYQRQ